MSKFIYNNNQHMKYPCKQNEIINKTKQRKKSFLSLQEIKNIIDLTN